MRSLSLTKLAIRALIAGSIGLLPVAATYSLSDPSLADTPATASIGGSALNYAIYGGGLQIAAASINLDLSPDPLLAELVLEPRGIPALFTKFRLESSLQARSEAGALIPAWYRSSYFKNDRLRRSIEIEYNGDKTAVVHSDPSQEEEDRPKVPEALRQSAVDPLAAGLMLLRRTTEDGTCKGSLSVFDGRRLFDLSVMQVGSRKLSPSDNYAYSGPVMVCRLTLTQVAGFEEEETRKKRFPTTVEALVAPSVNGGPALPVRLEGASRIGMVVVRLESMSAAFQKNQRAQRD